MLVLSVFCNSEFEPSPQLILWSGPRRRLLVLYNPCARANMFVRRFLFLSHPFEWFFNAAEDVKERSQQQDNEDIATSSRCLPASNWTGTVNSRRRVHTQSHPNRTLMLPSAMTHVLVSFLCQDIMTHKQLVEAVHPHHSSSRINGG